MSQRPAGEPGLQADKVTVVDGPPASSLYPRFRARSADEAALVRVVFGPEFEEVKTME